MLMNEAFNKSKEFKDKQEKNLGNTQTHD